MKNRVIETARLRLLEADRQMVELELNDRPGLFALLNVPAPESWPPPLNDDDSYRYFLRTLDSGSCADGWGLWYVFEKTGGLVGLCGFKGRPDAAGMTEIGYSIVPNSQRQGFATEAAAGLIEWAEANGARIVAAETFPDLIASIGVMEKNGLRFLGEGSEEGVIRYQRELS